MKKSYAVDMAPINACEQAERDRNPDWPERALEALLKAGRALGTFTTEQARYEAYRRNLIEIPHDERAWGAVIMRASRGRMIVTTGEICRANSSNGNFKPVWVVL